MIPRSVMVILVLATALAGCQEKTSEPTIPGPQATGPVATGLLSFNKSYPFHVDALNDVNSFVSGGAFGYDNCAIFAPDDRDDAVNITSGRAMLSWNSTTELELMFQAENGANLARSGLGPSPRELIFGPVRISDEDRAMGIGARLPADSGEFDQEGVLVIQFEYTGDSFLEGTGHCGWSSF